MLHELVLELLLICVLFVRFDYLGGCLFVLIIQLMFFFFFFFKQKTAYEMRISDWSSDVCSSDLIIWRSSSASLEPCATAHRSSSFPRTSSDCNGICCAIPAATGKWSRSWLWSCIMMKRRS